MKKVIVISLIAGILIMAAGCGNAAAIKQSGVTIPTISVQDLQQSGAKYDGQVIQVQGYFEFTWQDSNGNTCLELDSSSKPYNSDPAVFCTLSINVNLPDNLQAHTGQMITIKGICRATQSIDGKIDSVLDDCSLIGN